MLLRKKRRKRVSWRPYVALIGGLFILSAILLAVIDYANFGSADNLYPAGLRVGGIPVGNLSRAEAEERLRSSFSVPIELNYRGARMQFKPEAFGFQLNTSAVLDAYAASQAKALKTKVWWQHLWGHRPENKAANVDLHPSADSAAIRNLIEHEIQPRYDQKAYAPYPLLNTTYFEPGNAGWGIANPEQTMAAIQAALISPTNRQVSLEIADIATPSLDPNLLEVALKVIIQNESFDGIVEIYTQDMDSRAMLHMAQQAYQAIPPDLAYSGASTIKIPIVVSVMRHLNGEMPGLAEGWIFQMLTKSLNPPTDMLMKTYLDEARGPLVVTQDMQDLGYQNTFLAGYFADGSPLLQRFTTPANSRSDINLNPDTYNQTVPSEIGDLLTRIYQCSVGAAVEKGLYNGQIGQAACEYIVNVMSQNRMGALIEAGLPPDQAIAHKHGWISDTDGLLHTISDVGIILDGEKSYVEVIFVHTPRQLIFDTGSYLVARLSQCIYNSKHIDNQTVWLGE
jgi:beta-lactamase class A